MTQIIFAVRSAAVAALVGLFILANIAPSQAADLSMNINNETGATMVQFYASSVGEDSWGEDILGGDVLPSGGTANFTFEGGSGACWFDLKAVFVNGDVLIANNVNVCEEPNYTYGE